MARSLTDGMASDRAPIPVALARPSRHRVDAGEFDQRSGRSQAAGKSLMAHCIVAVTALIARTWVAVVVWLWP
jgi:hypothetical protein